MRKIYKMLLDTGRDVHGGFRVRLGKMRERSRRGQESQLRQESQADVSQMGMTLIEIMVVVAIIGLLMGAVGVMAFGRYKKAQISTTEQIIKNLETAVQTYMMDNNGDCPKDLEELYTAKIVNKKPRDAWGQSLLFKCPGDHNKETADIESKGPDKREGTEDDLANWEKDDR
ncbi:MAG: type II secretion system protein GspG [Deltaproteobacteria bacterium]|nr:type II secretion system protein GspG [Deltaproteobacteria bacterium]